MSIVNECYKSSPMYYDYPPNEQINPRNKNPNNFIATGVAVLINDKSIKTIFPVVNANQSYTSSEIRNSTPFTINGLESLITGNTFNVVNVHIIMTYSNISDSLTEFYDKVQQNLKTIDIMKTIIVGDFNAKGNKAFNDFRNHKITSDFITNTEYEHTDDQILIGKGFTDTNITTITGDLNLLEININSPTSDPKWRVAGTPQKFSPNNLKLIENNKITTDHQLLGINIDL